MSDTSIALQIKLPLLQTRPKSRPHLPPAMAAKMWQPGAPSPNPNGRPKGPSITTKIMTLLHQIGANGKSNDEVIADTLLSLATRKDFRATKAIEMIWDRVDGPVKQVIDVHKTQFSGDYKDLLDFMESAGQGPQDVIDTTISQVSKELTNDIDEL